MKKALSNDTNEAKFIGGKLLQPGETREFDVSDLPGEHQQPAAPVAALAQTLMEAMAELLLRSVVFVTAALPELSNEALDILIELEGQGAKRVSIARAVDAEKLRRSNEKLVQQHAGEEATRRLAAAEEALTSARSAHAAETDPTKLDALEFAVSEAIAAVKAAAEAFAAAPPASQA